MQEILHKDNLQLLLDKMQESIDKDLLLSLLEMRQELLHKDNMQLLLEI